MSKVIVIGGGIIGLTCAYYLRKKGYEVVVIDKGTPGAACSSGNLGWICPSLSQPVPAPGLVKTSLKWMMKRDSPLYIKPTAVPSLIGWLYYFWRNCNEEAFEKGFKAGLEISKNTLSLFDELEKEGTVDFEIHRKGLLYVYLKDNLIEEQFNELHIVEKFGLPLPVIKTKSEVLAMEPNLSDDVVGGLFLPAERHVRPESLIKGLYEWLLRNEVKMIVNTEVKDFVRNENQINGVRIEGEIIEGDQFLVTTGAWAHQLLKKIGYHLPMTAGKGYSITLSSPSITIQQPLYLGDSKVAISPYNGAIRIGGTMELSGLNTILDFRRIENIRNSTAKYLKTPLYGKEEIWTGMRPMTPDGLPVLGLVPNFNNLYIGSGHAMSGVSMSLATGSILSDLICFGKTDVEVTPFSPDRFNFASAILV
jgi:D-amino-acid dehydrogenase